jgi:hypothetical protein
MLNRQIEMAFGQIEFFAPAPERRQNRARWWFRRMRQIVDLAIDWEPTPRPRPVQIWFPAAETRRGTPLGTTAVRRRVRTQDQRQISE